ncbi:MAG: DUF4026 domain-containing protein [Lachnospiraceae bacterium]|nr:DUF4026 domain-containing protein [Lachnospiraceae bacterium]
MREPSYMIIIPMKEDDIKDPMIFIGNLEKSEDVRLKSVETDEQRGLVACFLVDDKEYQAEINPTDVDIPNLVRPAHAFTEEEFQKLDEVRSGLGICIDFDEDNARCFYDQLRIIHAMYPEVLAVLDCPSEKLLSGKWVALAAESKIPPAPRYLFTVQAISGENDEVWLHTHGMKRCGMYELEILCSDREKCNDHYKMIETFAYRMLENDGEIQPGEGVFIGQAAGIYLVCTAVDWKEALKFYPEATLGTEEDRDDEVHSVDTCVLMLYKNEEDEEAGKYTPIQAFDPFLQQNPMYMISTPETDRMSKLAVERIPYLRKAFENSDNTIIVKIGLTTDEEYWDDDVPQKEHIWFEVKDVDDDGIIGELTQEAYYVSGIKEGDIGKYPFSDVTDWIIFTKECRITPDDVYML